ncbi:MAG: putative sugar O-methyltransferase [Verrucomicrobiota bacterium]
MAVHSQLRQQYYQDADQSIEVTSSHWLEFGEGFRAEINEAGSICGYSNPGVAPVRWRNKEHQFADVIARRLHYQYAPSGALSIMKESSPMIHQIGWDLTLDLFRQACTLALLRKHYKNKPKLLLVIGDGYGGLALLSKVLYPELSVILVDLGKTLTMQAFYLGKAFPDLNHRLLTEVEKADEPGFYFCPAENADRIRKEHLDVVVNIASMQEMDSHVVSNYFSIVRSALNKDGVFYCCNRLEKQMPDGTWSRFSEYPWLNQDEFLVDAACPWHQYFMAPKPKGKIRIFGKRLPHKVVYDGVHWHRLAKMEKKV